MILKEKVLKKVNSKFIEDIKEKRDGKFLESTEWCVKILFLMFPKTENNSTSFPSLILDFKGFPKKPIEDPSFKKISVRNLNKEVLQEKNPIGNNEFDLKTNKKPLFEQTNKLLTLTKESCGKNFTKEKCKEKTITLKSKLQSFTKQNLTKTFTKQSCEPDNFIKAIFIPKSFTKPNNDKVRFAVGQPRIYLIFKCGISKLLRRFLQLQPFSLFNYLSSITAPRTNHPEQLNRTSFTEQISFLINFLTIYLYFQTFVVVSGKI